MILRGSSVLLQKDCVMLFFLAVSCCYCPTFGARCNVRTPNVVRHRCSAKDAHRRCVRVSPSSPYSDPMPCVDLRYAVHAAERHPSPHLHLLVQRYVQFWHQFSDRDHAALPPLQVGAPVTHQGKGTCELVHDRDCMALSCRARLTFPAPLSPLVDVPWYTRVSCGITEVQRVRNRTRDDRTALDDSLGGNAWAHQDAGNRGKGVKKPIAGPFPMIYVPFARPTEDKEFIKTYEGWRNGRYSAGRPWVIDSADCALYASASLRPACSSHLRLQCLPISPTICAVDTPVSCGSSAPLTTTSSPRSAASRTATSETLLLPQHTG